MYPDYTSGVVISSGTAILEDGWVQLSGSSGGIGLTLTINGTLLFHGGGTSSYAHYTFSPMLPVKVGDVITCTGIQPILTYYSNR